jgi:DNA-binding HxlR family transcriptional regulator
MRRPAGARRRTARPREARCYGQFCGLAKALDVVGERWTLLLVRDLMLGPKRFGDLSRGLEGLAPNLLATRLTEMQSRGLIEKVSLPDGRSAAYALTAAGRELEPALAALGQWGFRFLTQPSPHDRKDLAWGLFAMKARYRARAAAGAGKAGVAGGVTQKLVAEIRAEGRVFQFRLDGPHIDLRQDASALPDTILEGDGDSFRALFFRGASLAALRASGRVACTGSGGAVGRFLGAFGLTA